MKPRTLLSGLAILALSVGLSACSNQAPTIADPEGPGVSTSEVPSHLIVLSVQAGTTQDALQGALPAGAQILAFHPELGNAIVGLNSQDSPALSASSLQTQALSGIRAMVTSVERNNPMAVQQATATGTEAFGMLTWAGGMTTWAGGMTTWAGGLPYMTSSNQTTVNNYWNTIGLTGANTLVPTQGSGIKVAVMDTGVDTAHPFLAAQINTALGWDYIGNDSNPKEEQTYNGVVGAKYGHGTAVAGVVLQVAPKATIVPFRVLKPDGTGDVSNLIYAIDKAVANGINVINISLGMTSDSAALNTSIRNAITKNVLVVNSAGNAGTSAMLYPARTISSTDGLLKDGLIAVGSVDSSGYKSTFSTYASNMSLAAPGNGIITSYPGGRIVTTSGTSFSAPAVAGALALGLDMRSRFTATTKISPLMVSSYLKNFTDRSTDNSYRDYLGTGMLDVAEFLKALKTTASGKLIPNPGFEEGLQGWEPWSYSGKHTTEITLISSTSSRGRNAVLLGSGNDGIGAGVWFLNYPLLPGKTYTLSGDMKNLKGGWCIIGAYMEMGSSSNYNDYYVNTYSTSFTRLTKTFVTPTNMTKASVYGYKGDDFGQCIIDNLTVTEQ